jgi:hypothetical protein
MDEGLAIARNIIAKLPSTFGDSKRYDWLAIPLSAPVDGYLLGELVRDEDADLIALNRLDGRTRRLAVIAP